MKISRVRIASLAAAAGLFAVLLSGCVVPVGGGYDEGGVSVGLGVDYYEPYGGFYGGWGPGYRVAPFRGGGERREDFRAGGSTHAFRSAPAGRSMPSIPSRGHSGGGGGGRRH
jgi:hypothetical protein